MATDIPDLPLEMAPPPVTSIIPSEIVNGRQVEVHWQIDGHFIRDANLTSIARLNSFKPVPIMGEFSAVMQTEHILTDPDLVRDTSSALRNLGIGGSRDDFKEHLQNDEKVRTKYPLVLTDGFADVNDEDILLISNRYEDAQTRQSRRAKKQLPGNAIAMIAGFYLTERSIFKHFSREVATIRSENRSTMSRREFLKFMGFGIGGIAGSVTLFRNEFEFILNLERLLKYIPPPLEETEILEEEYASPINNLEVVTEMRSRIMAQNIASFCNHVPQVSEIIVIAGGAHRSIRDYLESGEALEENSLALYNYANRVIDEIVRLSRANGSQELENYQRFLSIFTNADPGNMIAANLYATDKNAQRNSVRSIDETSIPQGQIHVYSAKTLLYSALINRINAYLKMDNTDRNEYAKEFVCLYSTLIFDLLTSTDRSTRLSRLQNSSSPLDDGDLSDYTQIATQEQISMLNLDLLQRTGIEFKLDGQGTIGTVIGLGIFQGNIYPVISSTQKEKDSEHPANYLILPNRLLLKIPQ